MSGTRSGGVRPANGSGALDLRQAAVRLFGVLSDGAKGLRFNLRRGFARRDARSHQPIQASFTQDWRPARDRDADGTEMDRFASAAVLEQHLRGHYDVAVEAPSWSSLLVLDIDRPHVPRREGEPIDLEAELRANLRRDDVLAAVWRAFDLGADRQPVIFRTPGNGYHVYFPLCRDEKRRADQNPWPLRFARQHVEHRLNQARLGLKPGVLELYPSGVPLRAPCGRGMALLVPRNPDDPDELQLEAVHVTRDARGREARAIVPMVDAFLDGLKRARRPLEEWLARDPERPAWDPHRFGPFGLREKPAPPPRRTGVLSQHDVEVPTPFPAGARRPVSSRSSFSGSLPPPASVLCQGPGAGSPARDVREQSSPSGSLLYGAAFVRRVTGLLVRGVRHRRTRHDAVLKLAYYFVVLLRHDEAGALRALEDWLREHAHASATRDHLGEEKFVQQSLREAGHYVRRLAASGRRATPSPTRAFSVARTLAAPDLEMLAAIVPGEARDAGRAILTYLATFADDRGRVPGPIDLSTNILTQLCGEQRVASERGARSRAYVVAVSALLEAGLVTVHTDYSTSRHGRRYAVWYRFGSGERPRARPEGLLLGSRTVEEGQLLCVSEGRHAVPLLVPQDTAKPAPVRAAARPAWWQALYERRAFTPAEFFEADERHVLAGPFRDRRGRRREAPDTLGAPAVRNDATIEDRCVPAQVGVPRPTALPRVADPVLTASLPQTLSVPSPLRAALERAWAAWARAHGDDGS